MDRDTALQLLTPRRTGELLGVSEDTVRRLIATARIPAVTVGPRSLRIRLEDLTAFIAQNTTNTGQAASAGR